MKELTGNIYEYDIFSAGYNIVINEFLHNNEQLKDIDLIRDYIIQNIIPLKDNKNLRNIFIGNLQLKFPQTKEIISKRFKYNINKFIENNNLQKREILYRTKDSIFTTKQCTYLKVDKYEFREINYYNYFLNLKINSKNILIFVDTDNFEKLTIKGYTKLIDEMSYLKYFIQLLIINYKNNINKQNLFNDFVIFKKEFCGNILNYITDDDLIHFKFNDNILIGLSFKNSKKIIWERDFSIPCNFLEDFMNSLLSNK